MVTPYLPFPPSSGGQVRSYNLIKQLYRRHEITLYCYIRDEKEREYIPKLERYCKKVMVFKRRKAWSIFNIFLAGLSLYPFLVAIYLSMSLKKALKEEISKGKYDLIHSETFYVLPNIPQTNIPVFLVEQTIEYLVYQKFVEMLPWYWLPLKPFLLFDVVKIRWWEKYFWKKSTRLAAMSQEDKEFMLAQNPNLKIDVIANGVDIEYFQKTRRKKNKFTVLFVGQFKWLPNKDAAKFLAYDIWPIIKKQMPEAKLLIVGRDPTPDILSLNSLPDVTVLGEVADIRSAYGQASVLLAPIRNGRGTKYKILEAMATKLPVVGTPLAVEGIAVRNGKDVLIGKNAKQLAELTVRVLKDTKLRQRLVFSAYNVVKEKYNWKVISQELDRVYKEVASGKGS